MCQHTHPIEDVRRRGKEHTAPPPASRQLPFAEWDDVLTVMANYLGGTEFWMILRGPDGETAHWISGPRSLLEHFDPAAIVSVVAIGYLNAIEPAYTSPNGRS